MITTFGKSVNSGTNSNTTLVPDDVDVVFVSDLFVDDLLGGAELSSEALIRSSPLRVFKVRSKDLSVETLQSGFRKYWIFGNYAGINPELIPSIVGNLKYSVVEYDYKFCKYRSLQKHISAESTSCDCSEKIHGKLVSAFLYGAKSLWWMSEDQMKIHHEIFPFLTERENTVLSSVFDEDFFRTISILRDNYLDKKEDHFVVLGSSSWVKGTQAAEKFCQEKDLKYKTVWQLPYDEMLEELAKAKGLVFLPVGDDTCPRIVIEAKLLGCQLVLNDHVQHAREEWFNTDDVLDTESYLYLSRQRFWNGIVHDMNHVPTVSGYTTTLDCITRDYPYEESITSMLGFCDQVVVVDGGSTDGTWERLQGMSKSDGRLHVVQNVLDMSDVRFARFDGEQKAFARKLCTSHFCWQQDADEVVHESDYGKIKTILREFPPSVNLLSLPVVEFWGSSDKVRMDVMPWKWRLSKNHPSITHGIPAQNRRFDDGGRLFASPGTDGCDYVDSQTFLPIPNASFYTQDVDLLRRRGLSRPNDRLQYEKWFRTMVEGLPSVRHYSWFDIARKVRTYRDYWSRHWQSLYDVTQEDTAENNMFFDSPWSEVTESQIDELADTLSREMGGWIFHEKLDITRRTPHLTVDAPHPTVMKPWIDGRRK